MNVSFVPGLPFVPCKSQFLTTLPDKNKLPQVQQLNKFITDNNITDVSFDSNTSRHDMIGLVTNQDYQLLSDLGNDIVANSQRAKRYLYLAVNKFLIYSNSDISVTTDNFDLRLVDYCQDTIKDTFSLIDYTVRPDDNGTLGNFVHPVTTLFFKRND